MARKKDRSKSPQQPKQDKGTSGEQLDLIDVSPENAKEIIECARWYKAAEAECIAAKENEVAWKDKLLGFIKEANLQCLDNGMICLKLGHFTIKIKPRDDLLTVKEDAGAGKQEQGA